MPDRIDPAWIAKIYNEKGGDDFLGLRSVQNNMTGYLMPGITTITPRARYYSYYSWLLVEYGEDHAPGQTLRDFIRRREQIFVLANIAHVDALRGETYVAGLAGWRSIAGHWRAYRNEGQVPLNAQAVEKYLGALRGGYDAYAGVMVSLNNVRLAEDDASILEILPNGQKLAEAFVRSVEVTEYYQRRREFDTTDTIACTILEEYGRKCLLDFLSTGPDRQPVLEMLFAFDAHTLLPDLASQQPTRGNMRGSLGMILEMQEQIGTPLTDELFRRSILYGLCPDFAPYKPSSSLQPFVERWQLFQLREYYVYGLYGLWIYFLRWLNREGPQTLDAFYAHLNEAVDLAAVAAKFEVVLPTLPLDAWNVEEYFNHLLNQTGVEAGTLSMRRSAFTAMSQFSMNEEELYQFLRRCDRDDPAYVGATWLLLSTLYLRLADIQQNAAAEVWRWASEGGSYRRAMDLYVSLVEDYGHAAGTVFDLLRRIYRDYIIAQHTLVALEKWHARSANTFHFHYDDGLFDWVRDGETGFSASRFEQAYDMLQDLGLFDVGSTPDMRRLSPLGIDVLQRVMDSHHV